MLREIPVHLRLDMWNIPTKFTVTNIRHKPFTTVAFLQSTVLPGQGIHHLRKPGLPLYGLFLLLLLILLFDISEVSLVI
jgi:hypothetical protein